MEPIPVGQSCRVLDVSCKSYYEAKRRSARPVLCKASVHLKVASIVNPDRDSQDASNLYQSLLDKHCFICNMSRKGNCWAIKEASWHRGVNAVAERFLLNFKMKRVWQRDYANHAEAKNDITAYIVGFYHCQRLHSDLGSLPPSVFERNMAEKRLIDVCKKIDRHIIWVHWFVPPLGGKTSRHQNMQDQAMPKARRISSFVSGCLPCVGGCASRAGGNI